MVVVVSNIFYFHPYLGKIPILTNIFQMGWNHQPENEGLLNMNFQIIDWILLPLFCCSSQDDA